MSQVLNVTHATMGLQSQSKDVQVGYEEINLEGESE